MRAGDPDQAVVHYRAAVQSSPDNPNYKIALERAMLAASRAHLDRAKEFESQDQLDAARGEYRLTSEYSRHSRYCAAPGLLLTGAPARSKPGAWPCPSCGPATCRAQS